MIAFVLAAIALSFGARPAWAVASLLLGALTKFLPLLLFPPLALYLWRHGKRRAVRGILTGAAIAIAIGMLPYRPF